MMTISVILMGCDVGEASPPRDERNPVVNHDLFSGRCVNGYQESPRFYTISVVFQYFPDERQVNRFPETVEHHGSGHVCSCQPHNGHAATPPSHVPCVASLDHAPCLHIHLLFVVVEGGTRVV